MSGPEFKDEKEHWKGLSETLTYVDRDDIFIKWLEDQGYMDVKLLPEKIYAIIIGAVGDKCGYEDRWCYHTYEAAKSALDACGAGRVNRHTRTGRRIINSAMIVEE